MDGRWFAWVSEWNADVQSPADHRVPYPQPILSDIEFDTDGSMILGFRDRGSDQTGHLTRPPGLGTADDPVDNTNLYQANSGGDLIRVCWNGSSYEWEGTGSCPTNGNSPSEADTGAEATAEFYHEDYLDFISNGKYIHQETAQGALAFVPRLMDVASTVMDPFRPSTGGTRWFDNTNGTYTQPYEVFKGGDGPDENGLLNKANGLGDLEFICMPAPLEIGNYVWEDTDSDGIQDPNEAPIAGLTVTLYDMDNGGVQVGTATTDANGHYYFGGLSDANMTSGSLLTDNDYEVRISLADSNLPANASVTTANANGDVTNDNKTDLADSDAIENSGCG